VVGEHADAWNDGAGGAASLDDRGREAEDDGAPADQASSRSSRSSERSRRRRISSRVAR
jgi:hypothetical protein